MKIYTNEQIYRKRKIKESITEKIKLIIVIFISIIVIYNVTLIFQSMTKPDKTPSFLGKKTFTIISGSMEPNIEVGDIVVVVEVGEEELEEGDVITFRKNTEMITHRIQKIEEENGIKKYITKGDNNITEDVEGVTYKDIEGKVIKKIKYLGNIAIILKDKLTILAIIFTFIVIYMIDMKKQNKKIMRKNKKELLNKRRE